MTEKFIKADFSHHSIIANFQVAMAWETEKMQLDLDTCTRGVQAVFKDPSLGRYFVYERGGAVAACLLTTYEWSDWRNGMVWWIHSVYVDPAHRGLGIFSKMYGELKSLVEADPSVRGLRLYVEKSNHRAQGVYKKLGMLDHHYDLYEWLK